MSQMLANIDDMESKKRKETNKLDELLGKMDKNANHYVNEEDLRAEVYQLQYSKYLRECIYELIILNNIENFKIINDVYLQLKQTKNAFKSEDNLSMFKEVIIENLKTLKDAETQKIIKNINERNDFDKIIELLDWYQETLTLEEDFDDRITFLNSEIDEAQQKGIQENYSKERFGTMILLIVYRLSRKGNFVGYTDNYKADFYSNALEKILSYAINNIDLEMISPRTNERVKVFGYITQIASNAFVEVINKRNQENYEMMHTLMPLDAMYEQVKKHYNPIYDEIDIKEEHNLEVVFTNIEESVLEEPRIIYDVILKYSKEDEEESIILGEYNIADNFIITDITNKIKNINLDNKLFDTSKIKILYPANYILSLEEYEIIKKNNFEYLNITKYSKPKYVPSFPKRQKQEKEDMFNEWE